MGGLRYPTRAISAVALIAAIGLLVGAPGLAQPAPTLSVAPTEGESGSATIVKGTGFRGDGNVTLTAGGRFAGTTTAEPSGKLVAVPIIINDVGDVLVTGCQDDGAGDPCGYSASATFTASAPSPSSTTTTTSPTTTTTITTSTTIADSTTSTTSSTLPSSTTTSTSSATSTTSSTTVPGSTTTTSLDPSTTSTTMAITATTSSTTVGTTTTIGPSGTTTSTVPTSVKSATLGPPGLDAPPETNAATEESGPADNSTSPAVPADGPDEDSIVAAAPPVPALDGDEEAIWPFLLGGGAMWSISAGLRLLARQRSALRQ